MPYTNWESRLVKPEDALESIDPGMSIFLGTGVGEPRTLIKHLMASKAPNLQDLELIQLLSLGDALSLEALESGKFRLKTFFSGWIAGQAITQGLIDLIPCRFSCIPHLIESRRIPIDTAFVQVSPPNEAGFCSLGVAVDVARQAIEKADLVIGEINSLVPVTFGDTFVHLSEFDFLVRGTEKPIYLQRWPIDPVFDQVAGNVASIIEDGACVSFATGPLFEALANHLKKNRHLGVHSPIFTDALMDLVKNGTVTNRKKGIFRGKSLACNAMGTKALFNWLHRNPLVEFQSLDKVINPLKIGKNSHFVAIIPSRKVDLTGRVALHSGKSNVAAGPGEALNLVNGAEISRGGFSIFALPSRNLKGESNIKVSVESFPNLFSFRESVDVVVTEYGVSDLTGCTVRERAQALIEIAHPDDRPHLVEQAKAANILYPDQIYLSESAHLYPEHVAMNHAFANGLTVRIRAVKPSDEEQMRRLFYRFSDESVYYRYFSPIRTMPHAKMQAYVNIDYRKTFSIVVLTGKPGQGEIIAEARFARQKRGNKADIAFVVDEAFQNQGIATFMYRLLIRFAKEQGIEGFSADVLASNKAMMKVFEKGDLALKARLEEGVYHLNILL
jgi:acyl-CoA hydrolase/GNAT superfamily N-acetyltransferase